MPGDGKSVEQSAPAPSPAPIEVVPGTQAPGIGAAGPSAATLHTLMAVSGSVMSQQAEEGAEARGLPHQQPAKPYQSAAPSHPTAPLQQVLDLQAPAAPPPQQPVLQPKLTPGQAQQLLSIALAGLQRQAHIVSQQQTNKTAPAAANAIAPALPSTQSWLSVVPAAQPSSRAAVAAPASQPPPTAAVAAPASEPPPRAAVATTAVAAAKTGGLPSSAGREALAAAAAATKLTRVTRCCALGPECF